MNIWWKDTIGRRNRHYKGSDKAPCLCVWKGKKKKNGKTSVTRVEVSEGKQLRDEVRQGNDARLAELCGSLQRIQTYSE